MDTMPSSEMIAGVRAAAQDEDGVEGVDKIRARKTAFRYHVDLHIEVDPEPASARPRASRITS
jgi:divalent metal cation (Fe/Co/Zn/Cd) transporter